MVTIGRRRRLRHRRRCHRRRCHRRTNCIHLTRCTPGQRSAGETEYAIAEKHAQIAKKGIWSSYNPEAGQMDGDAFTS